MTDLERTLRTLLVVVIWLLAVMLCGIETEVAISGILARSSAGTTWFATCFLLIELAVPVIGWKRASAGEFPEDRLWRVGKWLLIFGLLGLPFALVPLAM